MTVAELITALGQVNPDFEVITWVSNHSAPRGDDMRVWTIRSDYTDKAVVVMVGNMHNPYYSYHDTVPIEEHHADNYPVEWDELGQVARPI